MTTTETPPAGDGAASTKPSPLHKDSETAQGQTALVNPTSAKPDRWNQWLTLGANIGVLIGLVVLVFEVRQTAALSRATMEQGKNEMLAQIELHIAQPAVAAAYMKSIRNPEDLTDAEIRIVDGVLVAVTLQWEHRFHMADAGLTTFENASAHVRNVAPYFFGSRFAKQWWSYQTSGWEGTTLLEIAGPVIDSTDENYLAELYDRLKITPPAVEGQDANTKR